MIAGAACLCAVLSCERVDTGGRDYSGYSDGRGVTVDDVFFSGVGYPAGYDWPKDREHSSVEAELFLASAVDWKMLSRPVGAQYAVAADQDMHRVVDGHLYEDWSGDSETVVSCDGMEIFRFPGRETFISFLVVAGDVYTLGFDRSDGRMNVRRNGQQLFSSKSIQPVSGLYEKDGGWGMTACPAGKEMWYVIENGSVSVVPCSKKFGDMVDLRYGSSGVVGITNYKGGIIYRMVGDSAEPLGVLADGIFRDVRVSGTADNLFVTASIEEYSGGKRCALWKNDDLLWYSDSGYAFYASCTDGDRVAVLGCHEASGVWWLWTGDGLTMIPQPYRPFSPEAFIYRGGKVFLSLVKYDGTPSLWLDGQIREYAFNGYIDHLDVVRRKIQD